MTPERPVSSIPTRRLRELEKKARAHDDYLEALRRLREDAAKLALTVDREGIGRELLRGYQGALSALSKHIVDVGGERLMTQQIEDEHRG